MQIVLFRHGPAGRRDRQRWPDDSLRPLTAGGRERTRRVARGLGRHLDESPRILSSPYKRALQTARILAEALELPEPWETHDDLAPGGSARRLMEHLGTLSPKKPVVLVGHEPDLGKLAGFLIFGAPHALPMKKGGACSVRHLGPIEPGGGRMEWFLPPRMLRRLARGRAPARRTG